MDTHHNLHTSIATSTDLLTLVSNKKSEIAPISRNGLSIDNKIKLLTLLKQLSTIPIKPKSQSIPSSIAVSNLNTQIHSITSISHLQTSFINSYILSESLNIIFNDLLSFASTYLSSYSNDHSSQLYLDRIDSLKADSRKLSSYIKILVNHYLFNIEFSHLYKNLDQDSLKFKKINFLKLLESLLNNNILHPNSNSNGAWLLIDKINDPLISFLLSNKLIVLHPTNTNKIMLNDLSVDL